MNEVTQTVLYCVLQILSSGPKARECHAVPKAPLVAYAIKDAHREYPSVPPPILAAVMAHESGFKVEARGAAGEVGLAQLLPRGAGMGLPDRVLENPRVNALLAARYLDQMRRRCGRKPVSWLSAYNGGPCRSGEYGLRVMSVLKNVQRSSK